MIINVERLLKQLRAKYMFQYIIEFWSGRDLTGYLINKWKIDNIIFNVGLQNLIDTCLLGTSPETDFFFELTAGSPSFAAADTPASHAGWTENQDYDEATRQTCVGVRSGQVVTNSASPAAVNVTTGSTFGGCALVSNSTKGNNADGVLFSGVAATEGNQTLGAGASSSMVYQITGADDGA